MPRTVGDHALSPPRRDPPPLRHAIRGCLIWSDSRSQGLIEPAAIYCWSGFGGLGLIRGGSQICLMKHVDMRSLAPAAQEERRRQVIGLRERGLSYPEIASQVGLTKNGVFDICKRFREKGLAGLRTGPRGPAPGTGRFLTAEQEADIRALICRGMPDAYGLSFALWSRAAVAALIEQRCGVRLAVRTMGTYLRRWRFTAQKPLRRAYEQDPAAVRRWLEADYPAIQAKARRQKGTIFWGDETGLR